MEQRATCNAQDVFSKATRLEGNEELGIISAQMVIELILGAFLQS